MFFDNVLAGISLDSIIAVIGLLAIYLLLREHKEDNVEEEEKKKGR